MTSSSIKIIVRADENLDDCLQGAADAYIAKHPELAGWDLLPEWTDEDTRETVTLTVPVDSVDGYHEDRLARAAAHVSAVELTDGTWAHYADETSSWHVVDADDLEDLCDYLDDEDPQVSGDAYSHWCAGTTSEERPEGWEPGDDDGEADTTHATIKATELLAASGCADVGGGNAVDDCDALYDDA